MEPQHVRHCNQKRIEINQYHLRSTKNHPFLGDISIVFTFFVGLGITQRDHPSLFSCQFRMASYRAYFGGKVPGADDAFAGAEDVVPTCAEESQLV